MTRWISGSSRACGSTHLVCSVAAGHGQNWGQGTVTACYGPLLLGTRDVQSVVVPTLDVKQSGSAVCLPPTLLSLVRPLVDGQGDMVFYNGGDSALSFSWRPRGEGDSAWEDLKLGVGEVRRISIRDGYESNA